MNNFEQFCNYNEVDENGDPAGGQFFAMGLEGHWQDGPVKENGFNGTGVETLLLIARHRLVESYQKSRFACHENRMAIEHIDEALEWLRTRTRNREERGVEGTNNE